MTESLIEGVGNEVLIYCGAFFAFSVAAFTFNRHFLNNQVFVHPDNEASSDGTPAQGQQQRSYDSDTCPICLGALRLAVETNCGHKFCGQCLKTYLDGGGRNSILLGGNRTCPLCRQVINFLLMSFTRDESTEDENRVEIETCVYEFNVRFGNGPRSLMTYIRDCPILIRHLIANFFCYEGIVWFFRLRVLVCAVAAIMYLLMPLDIIPEAVFGMFGLLDDVFIVFLCAIYLSIIYRQLLLNRANEADL